MPDKPIEPRTEPFGDTVWSKESRAPEALAIHCSDPRFQGAFRGFLAEELGLKNYAPLVIGGSIHAFGSREALPRNFEVLWDQIRFFIKHADIRQVIIINHADCAWYKANVTLYPDIDLAVKEKLDLGTTADRIGAEFPDVEVRSFWAGLDGDTISFSEVK